MKEKEEYEKEELQKKEEEALDRYYNWLEQKVSQSLFLIKISFNCIHSNHKSRGIQFLFSCIKNAFKFRQKEKKIHVQRLAKIGSHID